MNSGIKFSLVALCAAVFLAGCDNGDSNPESTAFEEAFMPDWVSLVDPTALLIEPRLVDCQLSGGTKTTCVSLTVSAAPTTVPVGPWCPRNVADVAADAGIWLESGKVYDVDGEFIRNLATFYDDEAWLLYDKSTGSVNVTDSRAACQAAARPDVDEAYHNHCVECQISYLEAGKSQTYVIPIEPQPSAIKQPSVGHDGVGIALSGVRLDAPAPTQAILSAYTLAPFDDCGGHVNLPVGYHLHAVTDCLQVADSENGHAPMLGIALDGYSIHTQLNVSGSEPSDLDSCRGHSTSDLGYHYHAGAAGGNAIIGCHSAQTGCALDSSETQCDESQHGPRRGPPGRPPPAEQHD